MDAGAPFEIEEPPADQIPLEPIADLQPENVYALALANLPQQKVNDFNLKAAQKNSLAAKGCIISHYFCFWKFGYQLWIFSFTYLCTNS